jgi:hypothetical protein
MLFVVELPHYPVWTMSLNNLKKNISETIDIHMSIPQVQTTRTTVNLSLK